MSEVLDKIKENIKRSVFKLEEQGIAIRDFSQEFGNKRANEKFRDRDYVETKFSLLTNDVEEISINQIVSEAFKGISSEQLGSGSDKIQYSLSLNVNTLGGFNVRKTYLKVRKSEITIPDIKINVIDESAYLVEIMILVERSDCYE